MRRVAVTAVISYVLSAGCATRLHTLDAGIVSPDTAVASDPEAETQQKNFIVPAIEIVAMDALINLVGRRGPDGAAFEVTAASISRNLRGRWVIDDDPFQVNQFLHPYQGAMYHTIARSSGLNYWQSLGYTFAGSALWEIAGETTRPSKNDQIASGIAGTFLGEPLFRTARLVLDQSAGRPGLWRVLAATVVAPPVGVNRMLFGDRFDPPVTALAAASDIRLQIGVTAPLTRRLDAASALRLKNTFVGLSVDYGFPGKSGYTHARPFDYFNLDATASSEGLDSLATRGLIAGKDYSTPHDGRGVWGLYGSYDYFAPDVFRVSSTALSFGTTAQWRLGPTVTLHTTALAGTGYTAAQSAVDADGRDYHYGVAPQALAGLRVIGGRRASLDLTARQYYVSNVAGFGTRDRDVILRGDASLALRLYREHAIAIKYLFSRRDASHPDLPRLTQTRSTIGVFYTLLGSGGFGALR